ncbi:hypothetical protein [Desertibacillus haloalkaliphilus]|uniref:hypothetical protein n=1 Tax=Desertibacillus haloalkaliphilus TaxID=1328930 RepID=UPI001C27BD37|nr:hypothetical protein [Desertibacillus haloalkaliphilus]MBU8907661.1 hypothetical protein [Desertibacillus haloalkaliphilus]
MNNFLYSLLLCGYLFIMIGCSSESTEVALTEEGAEPIVLESDEGISTSILSDIAKFLREHHRLEDVEALIGTARSIDDLFYTFEDDYGYYSFSSIDGLEDAIINEINIELKDTEKLHYEEAFHLLGFDIELGDEIESENFGSEGYVLYDVIGEDADVVLVERFVGTGAQFLSVSTDVWYGENKGYLAIVSDLEGYVTHISLYYEEDVVEQGLGSNNFDTALFTPEIAVHTLIGQNIRIGDPAEYLLSVSPEAYSGYSSESFFLSNDLYGHTTEHIITSLTVRLDANPITLDEAEVIMESILPVDVNMVDYEEESPYIRYQFESPSLPEPSTINVKIGYYGEHVSVIGFTSDVGTTMYFN